MAEKYIAVIQVPGQPMYRPAFIAAQRRAKQDGNIYTPEATVILETDERGLITIPAGEFQDEIVEKFVKHFIPKYNTGKKHKVLAGPFDSTNEAHLAQHKLRPKTDIEIADENASIAKTVTVENDELKKRIAELESQIKTKEPKK